MRVRGGSLEIPLCVTKKRKEKKKFNLGSNFLEEEMDCATAATQLHIFPDQRSRCGHS